MARGRLHDTTASATMHTPVRLSTSPDDPLSKSMVAVELLPSPSPVAALEVSSAALFPPPTSPTVQMAKQASPSQQPSPPHDLLWSEHLLRSVPALLAAQSRARRRQSLQQEARSDDVVPPSLPAQATPATPPLLPVKRGRPFPPARHSWCWQRCARPCCRSWMYVAPVLSWLCQGHDCGHPSELMPRSQRQPLTRWITSATRSSRWLCHSHVLERAVDVV